jgi:hypothetical protein
MAARQFRWILLGELLLYGLLGIWLTSARGLVAAEALGASPWQSSSACACSWSG